MQENNLKGLWIPFEILTNEYLSDKEKYIYSLILFFSKNDGYCTISKSVNHIDNNNNNSSSKDTTPLVENNKYINNNKYNNYILE